MKTFDFYSYAKNAIEESIKALADKEEIAFYGNPNECTIESYFASQICDGKLYDHCSSFEEEYLIGELNNLRETFEEARQDAYEEYLEENETEEVSNY